MLLEYVYIQFVFNRILVFTNVKFYGNQYACGYIDFLSSLVPNKRVS